MAIGLMILLIKKKKVVKISTSFLKTHYSQLQQGLVREDSIQRHVSWN